MSPTLPISISGLGCLSALGHNLAEHAENIANRKSAIRPLAELPGSPDEFASLPAAWIEPRRHLCHRKWAPTSVAAIHVVQEALADAGWSSSERREAAIFAGTSRGSLAGWIEPWPGRRSFPLMAASNSLPSEPAAAVAREFGIEGPWQVLSSGCCAGLDALGMAAMWLRAGMAKRAVVLAVDLPLIAPMLEAYASTGIISAAGSGATGMVPAEGAAAVCLELAKPGDGMPRLLGYHSTGEPSNPLGGAPQSPALLKILAEAVAAYGQPFATVPHASGTPAHAVSEPEDIKQVLGPEANMVPIKPLTGHTIGASGLVETSILCHYLRRQSLPAVTLDSSEIEIHQGSLHFKLASAMGGKHSLVAIHSPHE